jgi:hypothetical protein
MLSTVADAPSVRRAWVHSDQVLPFRFSTVLTIFFELQATSEFSVAAAVSMHLVVEGWGRHSRDD